MPFPAPPAPCQAYVSYKVLTRTSAPGYRGQSEVIRRFRDFVWLQRRLRREYRGALRAWGGVGAGGRTDGGGAAEWKREL